ncbi:pyrophosphate--fructose-6-phosphate 1-phosphotransferase [Methylobacterium nodulans]|uniref:Pyrophosphate--fructose 6-phosphate 1-phosphotransferase n=1 Tax=Methylobacterium nodulans (strain LMG 21967 / CNCM I-2342 / ORS 2060) TaxID=460265 RepID=B8IF02_METNO|nr:pyrophosphate--fructose-6-phosphate 1-phosphotransferase [Methylobacterium nodulans]ACL55713.1 phosphofructokinase [Methylobacterium nodulans ORS 2060]
MTTAKVAMLTAGGLAPCLSAAVGGLIGRYTDLAPEIEIIGYRSGYWGLLKGEALAVTPAVRAQAGTLLRHGGSPLGNSRVKLTNVKDCVKRGLVREGEDPLKVAAEQLARDGITILHTIGGDDTNSTAAELAAYLDRNGYRLTVVGLPKTIDNDVVPIRQSLGAWTAAEQGALFFENIANEQSANPRMLLVHEVMGRNCGWLTAATARAYRERFSRQTFLPDFNLTAAHKDIDAVYVPEVEIDLDREAERLRARLAAKDCVTIFLSEGAGLDAIVAEIEGRGEVLGRDAFGHVKIDTVHVGQWFADRFGPRLGVEKTLVQKSGHFSRSAAPNAEDLHLIQGMVDLAVDCALRGVSGVIGHDEEHGGRLRAIEFARIRGGKAFDPATPWFTDLLDAIGQPHA